LIIGFASLVINSISFVIRLKFTYFKKVKADIEFKQIDAKSIIPPEAMRLFFWQLQELKIT